jgi:hypothetical protein
VGGADQLSVDLTLNNKAYKIGITANVSKVTNNRPAMITIRIVVINILVRVSTRSDVISIAPANSIRSGLAAFQPFGINCHDVKLKA